jgi:hypothetical protein
MHFFDLKQNGHPVSPNCICFDCEVKTYTKEACDVRTDYSILFPLSSNQNYQSTGFARCQRGAHPSSTRQTLFADLSMLRPKGLRHPQLDAAHDSRFEPGNGQSVDQLSVSQAVLCQMPADQHRGSEPVSSLSAGDPAPGALYSPLVSVYDRHRSGSTPAVGLENGQKHRQMVFRASIRSTRLKRAAGFSGGRNIGKKRPPLLDRSLGLSVRSRGLCRRASKIQDTGKIFQSIEPAAAKLN